MESKQANSEAQAPAPSAAIDTTDTDNAALINRSMTAAVAIREKEDRLKKLQTVRIHTAMAIMTGVFFTISLFVDSLLATGSNSGSPAIPHIDINGNLPAGSQIARLLVQMNNFISKLNTGLQHITAHVGLATLKCGSHLTVLMTLTAFIFCLYLCYHDYKQREQHHDQATSSTSFTPPRTPVAVISGPITPPPQ